ncbi:MAG: nucleoside hydrolase, partial [Chloroflexales bacterium]|nr:nucleoside hydrolase [Chloroflexales bacterium]
SGVALPLIRPPFTAPETHGASGLGYARLPDAGTEPVGEHAVDLLIREIMARPGEVTLVAVAPLTNVAIALRKEPRIAQAVREVIIMGGALRADGNTTPLAEFNVYVDPHAAHIVLHSGMPITLIPWDITRDVQITQQHVDRLLRIPSPIPRFIADATRFYIEFHLEYFGFAACSINDPAALALAFMPDLATTEAVFVDVEINSETTMGKTVGDFLHMRGRAPNVKLVTAFDNERFIELFVERMERLAQG